MPVEACDEGTYSPPRRKREVDDLPRDLDGSTLPPGVSRDVSLGKPVTLPLRFFLQLPPGSAATVAAWLDAECEEFARRRRNPVYGVWFSIRSIARGVGLAESTVRNTALKWMVARRWVELTDFMVDGELQTMVFCKWRMPDPFEGAVFNFGHGVKVRLENGQVEFVDPAESIPESRPDGRPSPAPILGAGGAPKSAPNVGDELKREYRKTTDREDAKTVVVQASPGGENPEKTPDLDPRIAATLERQIADPGERAELAAKVPTWTLIHRVEWIINAIRQLAVNREKLRAKGRKIRDLASYAEGILADWKAAGRCTLRGIRETPEPIPNLISPAQSAADAEARRRDDESESRRDSLWSACPEAERQALSDEWDRSNPPMPSADPKLRRSLARFREVARLKWCREEHERREGAR
jgi:hypothetical protein